MKRESTTIFGRIMHMEERIVLDGNVAQPDAANNATADAGNASAQPAPQGSVQQAAQEAQQSQQDSAPPANASAANDAAAAPNPAANSVSDSPLRALLINDQVDPYGELAKSIADNVLLYTYHGATDSLADILQGLQQAAGGQTLDSIALATHSQGAGTFVLGSDEHVSLSVFGGDSSQQAFFSNLGALLTQGGRIDLLSCNLAGMPAGDALLDEISRAAGAEVAASTDPTGAAAKGGDWLLERGGVDASALYFDSTLLANYDGILASETKLAEATDTGFGRGVAIDGIYMVVTSETGNGGTGIGYVYKLADHDSNAGTPDTWAQTLTLTPQDGTPLGFGYCVSISGTTIAIGAQSSTTAGGTFAGSVYLFDAATGNQLHRIDGLAADDQFGSSVALSGTTLVVGAKGVASNNGADMYAMPRLVQLTAP